MKRGIVIPCYNESARLKFGEFATFLTNHPNYKICFVNDGSNDDTIDHLNRFKVGREDQVMICDLTVNQGKAEAVRQGTIKLIKETKVDNIGFIDADLSTGFEDYKGLVQKLESNGQNTYMVFGSRKLSEDSNIDRSMFRDIASTIVGFSINKVVGLPIKDTQCGAKVFTRALANQLFQESFLTRWLFDVEIFLRMKNIFKSNVLSKLQEVALANWADVDGSKLSFTDSVKIPLMLSKIAMTYGAHNMNQQLSTAFQNIRLAQPIKN